jgi:hypothetical protein
MVPTLRLPWHLSEKPLLAVLFGHRAEESHRKDAKDAKETAKGANGCQ